MAKKTKKLKPRKRTAQPLQIRQMIFRILVGAGGGMVLAVLLLAAASLGMKVTAAGMGAASGVSQGIKVICAAAAGLIAFFGGGPREWLRGLCAGAAAMVGAGLLLGLLGAPVGAGFLWLADAGMGAVTGLATAIVAGLFKRG